MNICFIVGAFPNMKCGIGDYTFNLAKTLANMNYNVSVITSTDASTDVCDINICNIVTNWNFRNLKKIMIKLKELRPDVVCIQYPSNEYKKNLMINFLPLFIKRKIKIPIIETIHEYSVFTILGKIRNTISLYNADRIVVVEEEYISMIKRLNKKSKITYIPITSSISKSNLNSNQIDELRKKIDNSNDKLISYFGFANQTKGIEELFYMIKKIQGVKLLFISELDNNVEYHKKLIELYQRLNLEDKIIITGFLEEKEVANYLKCSDVCVIPFKSGVSKRNSSFLAAYNQNIPIVTTTKGKTFLKDSVYYVQIGNKDILEKKIRLALKNKEKIDRKINTWESIAKEYIKIIGEIYDNRN